MAVKCSPWGTKRPVHLLHGYRDLKGLWLGATALCTFIVSFGYVEITGMLEEFRCKLCFSFYFRKLQLLKTCKRLTNLPVAE